MKARRREEAASRRLADAPPLDPLSIAPILEPTPTPPAAASPPSPTADATSGGGTTLRLPAPARPDDFPVAPLDEPAPPEPARPDDAVAQLLSAREQRARRSARLYFILAVLLPTAAAAIYFAFLATPRYLAEAKFVVRGTVEMLEGESTRFTKELSAFSRITNNQETHIIADHILSRSMVEALLKHHDLYAIYQVPRRDPSAQPAADPASDALLATWLRMVRVHADTTSGFVTLSVEAYTPEDAQKVAEAILTECRLLVDELTARARQDRLERTAREVLIARKGLAELLKDFQAFRDREGTVDASYSALTLQGFTALLRDQRVTLQAELSTTRATAGAAAPAARTLEGRIASLDQEIRKLEEQIEGKRTEQARLPVPGSLMSQELLETRRTIIIERVSRAEAAQSVALAEADRQQVFLMVYQPPSRPHVVFAPWITRDTAITFLVLLGFWYLGASYVSNLRAHG